MVCTFTLRRLSFISYTKLKDEIRLENVAQLKLFVLCYCCSPVAWGWHTLSSGYEIFFSEWKQKPLNAKLGVMKYSPPAKHIITCMTNAIVIMPVGRSTGWVGPRNESAGEVSNGKFSSCFLSARTQLARNSHDCSVTVRVVDRVAQCGGKGNSNSIKVL